MKPLSALKVATVLCASTTLISGSFGQSPPTPPDRNPGGRYPTQNPGASQEEIQQARERELQRKGGPESGQDQNLDDASRALGSATYSDRKQVVDTLKDSIVTAKKEEDSLKDSADDLSKSKRTEFDAAVKEAEARRDSLEESCDELKDAKAQNWDLRKRDVAKNLELYREALDRTRQASGKPPVSQSTPRKEFDGSR